MNYQDNSYYNRNNYPPNNNYNQNPNLNYQNNQFYRNNTFNPSYYPPSNPNLDNSYRPNLSSSYSPNLNNNYNPNIQNQNLNREDNEGFCSHDKGSDIYSSVNINNNVPLPRSKTTINSDDHFRPRDEDNNTPPPPNISNSFNQNYSRVKSYNENTPYN